MWTHGVSELLWNLQTREGSVPNRNPVGRPDRMESLQLYSDASFSSSAVFTWTNMLVVVVELDGSEQEALDLVPLVTNVLLEEHYLVVGVVVVVDIGVIPINSRGEKQRMHLRDGFLADQLDPIYVAYNM